MPRTYTNSNNFSNDSSFGSDRMYARSFGDMSYYITGTNKITFPVGFNMRQSFITAQAIQYFQNTGSNQNLIAENDDGLGGNGRILSMIRSNRALSTFIDGTSKDSNFKVPRGEWGMLAQFYNHTASQITSFLGDFKTAKWTTGDTLSVTADANAGDIILYQSKVAGGQLGKAYNTQLLIVPLSSLNGIPELLESFFRYGTIGVDTPAIYSAMDDGSGTTVTNTVGTNGTATAANWRAQYPKKARTYS